MEDRKPPAPAEKTAGKAGSAGIASSAFVVLVPETPDVRSGVRTTLAGIPTGVSVTWESVRWFINGTVFRGYREFLPGGMFRRGDRIRASVEVTVNGGLMRLISKEAIVRNCLPDLLTVELSDTAPKTGQEVRALASGKDADGDPVSFRYRWFLNDQEDMGQVTDALSLQNIPKGSWVHAEVQAFDGISPGSKRSTPKVLVINSPPAVEQVTITRGTGGHFTANIRIKDPDGDPVALQEKSLPEGVSLSGTALSWEEAAIPSGKDVPVVLLLSDGDGGDVEYSFQITSGKK